MAKPTGARAQSLQRSDNVTALTDIAAAFYQVHRRRRRWRRPAVAARLTNGRWCCAALRDAGVARDGAAPPSVPRGHGERAADDGGGPAAVRARRHDRTTAAVHLAVAGAARPQLWHGAPVGSQLANKWHASHRLTGDASFWCPRAFCRPGPSGAHAAALRHAAQTGRVCGAPAAHGLCQGRRRRGGTPDL